MPIARATLSTIILLNKALGLVQCFYPVAPALHQKALHDADEIIKRYGAESSVADFPTLQKKLVSEDKQQDKQEGYCLREFKNFLQEVDPDNTWAHLTRMLLAEGKSVWVCPGCLKVLTTRREKTYDELRELCEDKKPTQHEVVATGPSSFSDDQKTDDTQHNTLPQPTPRRSPWAKLCVRASCGCAKDVSTSQQS